MQVDSKQCVSAVLLIASGLVVTVGCRKDHSSAHTRVSAGPSATQSPRKVEAVEPVKRVISCTEQRTERIDFYSGSGDLQNLRVAADGKGALLTWERLNQPDIGDSSQLGFGAAVGNGRTETSSRHSGLRLTVSPVVKHSRLARAEISVPRQ